MMVTVNLLQVIAVSVAAIIIAGFIGYVSGLKVGYLRGVVVTLSLKKRVEADHARD